MDEISGIFNRFDAIKGHTNFYMLRTFPPVKPFFRRNWRSCGFNFSEFTTVYSALTVIVTEHSDRFRCNRIAVAVAHIYHSVTGQRQTLNIGRSAHFSLQ